MGDDGWQGDVCGFLGDRGDGFRAGRAFGCYCCALAAKRRGQHVVGCFVDEGAAVLVKGADVLPDLYPLATVTPPFMVKANPPCSSVWQSQDI